MVLLHLVSSERLRCFMNWNIHQHKGMSDGGGDWVLVNSVLCLCLHQRRLGSLTTHNGRERKRMEATTRHLWGVLEQLGQCKNPLTSTHQGI